PTLLAAAEANGLDRFIHQFPAWIAGLVYFGVMLACWKLGWWSGRRSSADSGYDPGLKFTDASMAILGLLLAFSFAMAVGRHDQRRLIVVDESNAIADFYTCASLLQEPRRGSLQALIRSYTEHQIGELSRFPRESEHRETIRRSQAMRNRMTELVAAAVAEGT